MGNRVKIGECELYRAKKDKIRCLACSHKCLILEGKTGICGIRKNIQGKLFLLVYGKVVAEHVDPIEKKPFYNFLAGTKAYSIGTVGCNFKCDWCQNFDISQSSKGKQSKIFGEERSPEQIVSAALTNRCKSIAYTYNEPVIWIEFIRDIARIAKNKKLKNIFVTNGYWSKESLDYLNKERLIDAMNIDLKCFDSEIHLKYCGGKLECVLDTIKRAKNAGIHVEITTLIVPEVNDNEKQLRGIARFIAKLDKDIPWHISRFFPMYKMSGKKPTEINILKRAFEIGKEEGLNYVYLGNV